MDAAFANDARCRIESPSDVRRKYFLEKYGTETPEYRVEGTDREVFGRSWGMMNGNPGCLLYAVTSTDIPLGETVYYGKIGGMGEVVAECELVALEAVPDES